MRGRALAGLAAVALSTAGCPHRIESRVTQLAPVEARDLRVTFYGRAANTSDLYVCGYYEQRFDCLPRDEFERQLREGR